MWISFGFLHREFESFLPRQYKDLKPAQQALRQPQAPHHAGLFSLGSGVTAVGLRWRQSAAGVGAQAGGRDFAAFLSNQLFPFLPIKTSNCTLGEDGTNDGHGTCLGL